MLNLPFFLNMITSVDIPIFYVVYLYLPLLFFGDDFSIFAKTEAEASFLEVDENEGAISADPTPSRIAQVASAVQFSPITMPLLSPPASEILDRALDDDIKNSLQRFIK